MRHPAGMRHVTGAPLDRLEELRATDDILTPGTRVLTFDAAAAAVLVVDGADGLRLAVTRAADLPTVRPDGSATDAPLVVLGDRDGVRWAARTLPPGHEPPDPGGDARFETLRAAASALSAADAGLVLHGAGLLAWHRSGRYCGACGAPTRVAHAGHQRVCDGCGATHFPRTDPAVITLLRRGARCLLVNQPRWPPDRYAAVAGFVEPGESLEQAVAREVAEEVGLRVAGVEYFASQPWPFPHSLMIGFRATAAEGPLRLGDEIRDARWFTRPELRAAVDAGDIALPTPFSISRSLIDDWLAQPGEP